MRHLAVICDGNRRWAAKNGLPAELGHAQGLVIIENTCLWAMEHGIPFLTVFCFSTENWSRSKEEVDHIMNLARMYFTERIDWYRSNDIRVRFIGRRDRLPVDIVASMDRIERATAACRSLTLSVCVDYGGRDEIARAVAFGALTEQSLNDALCHDSPDPDMILRTGGQRRLSNFMIWQAAYTELYFMDKLFPDLSASDLDDALDWFNSRIRNFGK